MSNDFMVGKPLDGFTIAHLTEVYRVDVDGKKESTIGYFRDEVIARGFAENQTDANWHKTCEVMAVIKDDEVFLLGERIELGDEGAAALKIREGALAKLTAADRKVLGV